MTSSRWASGSPHAGLPKVKSSKQRISSYVCSAENITCERGCLTLLSQLGPASVWSRTSPVLNQEAPGGWSSFLGSLQPWAGQCWLLVAPCMSTTAQRGCGHTKSHAMTTRNTSVLYLLLLQQGQGVREKRHPERAWGDLRRHQGEQERGGFHEALLPIQPVEFSVFP